MSALPALIAAALRRRPDPDRLDQRDPALMEALVVPVLAAARAWYGLELTGLNNIPDGPALIVGNHDSGMTFLEAIGWGAAIHAARPHEAWLGLTHDGIIDMPGVGGLLISVGAVRARPDLALAALRAGHKVVVFPGGNTEAFRPWSRRYEVDLAGRIGWARLAIEAGVPVVPVVFCGGHRSFVVLSDNRWLARALGLHQRLRVDTWPLWLGLPWGLMLGPMFHVPLPVKVRTAMLAPEPTAHLTEADAQALADRVTNRMREAMHRLARLPGDAGPFGPTRR
jgi:1-acyl-sn-glycerol-3-phosphate acyltransferase